MDETQIGTIKRVAIYVNGEKIVRENLNVEICEGDEMHFYHAGGDIGVRVTPKKEAERRKKYERFWRFFGIDSHFPYKEKK